MKGIQLFAQLNNKIQRNGRQMLRFIKAVPIKWKGVKCGDNSRKGNAIVIAMCFVGIISIFSGCNKRDIPRTNLGIGLDFTVEISGINYSYLKYDGNCCKYCGELLGISLGAMSANQNELIMENEDICVYRADGARGYEIIVRKNTKSGKEDLMLVCSSNFEEFEDMLLFFGIDSSDGIASYDILRLNISGGKSFYEISKTVTNRLEIQKLYDFILTLKNESDSSEVFPSRGCLVLANSNDIVQQYNRIRKLQIHLTDGGVIPLGIVLPTSTEEGYVEFIDAAVQDEYSRRFKAPIDEKQAIH